MSTKLETPTILAENLASGLILRRGTPQDSEALSDFNAKIHSDDGPDKPDESIRVWTQDLLRGDHPSFKPEDFLIVEDPKTGQIVSSTNLISQTWEYAGVPFGVGRPELVGTLPEYRGQGLIRAQFEVLHEWSAARGEMLQSITGIPYYYRLYGYEMALDLGGGRYGTEMNLNRLKEGESEPYQFRPAAVEDLQLLAELYEQCQRRSLVSCVWDEDQWRYELRGKSSQNINRRDVRMIESSQGTTVGFLTLPNRPWWGGNMIAAMNYEIKPDVSWGDVTPSVLRFLHEAGKSFPEAQKRGGRVDALGLFLGQEHPAYQVTHISLGRRHEPYAWYIRVPDLPAFLRRITPVLERRLAESPYVGHTGELKITFYRSGLRLVFENGRLRQAESWQPTPVGHDGDAAFPGLTFLQLLMGYRSLDELHHAFVDCWYGSDLAYGLLSSLFPKQPSCVWPIS